MKLENEKTTRRHFEFAFSSAIIGVVGGMVALVFAFILLVKERMPWLALGAACYGVAMIWIGWSVGNTAEREARACEQEDKR